VYRQHTENFAPLETANGRSHLVITHFDSSFAGHIDMDNVGYAGTPRSVILEQLQQFAEEVMPAFTQRSTEPVAALR
jgi:hypothetical protein